MKDLICPVKKYDVHPESCWVPYVFWQVKDVKACILKKTIFSLTGVSQWIECKLGNQMRCWVDFQSGHLPGLQARSPVGGA